MKKFFNYKARRRQFTSILVFLAFLISFAAFQSCDQLQNITIPSGSAPLTEGEIIRGLKEALVVGATNSVSITNKTDGFFGNPQIRIPWPEEAAGAYNYINQNMPSLRPMLDEVVLKMNRGAETASAKAKPIFTEAVMSMTITDARNILRGDNNAATQYLHNKTWDALHAAFRPDIHEALESVGAATAWSGITTPYNRIARITPGVNTITTDLADYTTTQALNGLFLLLAEEEMKIRTDPRARVNEILRRVFGSLDN
jgi:hypothetical protein